MPGLFPDSDDGIGVDAPDRIEMYPYFTAGCGLVDVLASRAATTGEMPFQVGRNGPCLAAQSDGISGAMSVPGIRGCRRARREGCRGI